MSASCVSPTGLQTITIRSTPGLQLAFATTWPDRKPHQEWGASATTVIPPGGTYTQSWTVPPNAPTGTATTDITVAGRADGRDQYAMAHPTWRIATTC
ncbi:MAG: hypothetical protein QOG03_1480 [Actinomycetota bacterium]|jgi:hypothetical protein|nr:hypothetical protein [Actinomycetota bacterium]